MANTPESQDEPKVGRPEADIDEKLLVRLAEKLWSTEEIAATFGVHSTTINRRFAALIADCRQRGKAKLRDLLWQRALKGSDKVLLHMCKHHLDQHDKVSVTSDTTTKVEASPALTEFLTKLRENT